MSPETPQDPNLEAAPDDAVTPAQEPTVDDAAEAKAAAKKPRAKKSDADAEATDKPKRTRKTPAAKAKESAAEETGVDKAAAKAGAESEDEPKKPKRKTSTTKTEERVADKPAPAKRRRDQPGELVVVRAQARYVRSSARKARLVCDHIRGKSVPDARAILAFTPRAVAKDWAKVLESAVANAEHNHELVGEELRVTKVFADEGPTLKRFRPRAMGRATRIRKRTSHLTIELTPKEQ